MLNSCSCSLEAKAIQSLVRKQNNCPSFGYKTMSSRIPTEQATLVSIYTVQNRKVPVSIKHGLRAAECGMGNAECGMRNVECGLLPHYKTRTDS